MKKGLDLELTDVATTYTSCMVWGNSSENWRGTPFGDKVKMAYVMFLANNE